MKKINNIHISGCTFFFEEDASKIMEQYLARINELYRDNGEELKVADVEYRIAEFCKERVGEKGIVNAALINEAIENIGIKIEPQKEENKKKTEEQPEETPKEEEDAPWYRAMQLGNKAFRNPHQGYIGGVLAGLAAYFGISTALLRLITIIFFIIEPSGLLYFAYILLWAILPKAKSIIDHTRMRRVNAKGNKESIQAAWKRNYEQVMTELAGPPADGCLVMLIKLLFFLPLIPFAVAMCIIVIAIIVVPLGLIYMFAIGGLVTTTLLTMPLVIMGISIITAMAVILFAVIHWIFKKMRMCKPMKRWGKIVLITLLAVSLLFAGIAAYRIGKSCDNREEMEGKIIEEFDKFLGSFHEKFLAGSTVTSKTGDYYNKFDIDDNSDTVCGAIWYSETERCGMPLAIESVHNDEGEYNIYFYRTDNIEHDIYNKNYVAKYSLETNNGDYFNDGIYIVWDSINNAILLDGCFVRDEWGFRNNDNEITEINESGIKIHFVGFKDSLLYTNATEKGYPAFELRYNRGARPQLYTGGDELHPGVTIPANSTIRRGKIPGPSQMATTINSNGQKDTTQIYTNINIDEDKLNKTIDDVVELKNRADSIIKDAHDIVNITPTEK